MDRVTPEVRSAIMASVKQKNTGPEIVVRKLLHRMGYRFRLHYKSLPGTPDIVLPKYRVAIFVHGCFWHGHPGCSKSRRPSGHSDYWNAKLDRNLERDQEAISQLAEIGWATLVVWQCEIRNSDDLKSKILNFLTEHEGKRRAGVESGKKVPCAVIAAGQTSESVDKTHDD